jgi:acyl-CoA thioesterase FadM
MDLTPLPITQQAVIPESYLDVMGHMNVMWYTHLFSKAVGSVFRMIGIDRDYIQNHRAGAFALRQFFSYSAEVRAGEAITIRSRVLGRSAKRLHLIHFMTKDAGDVLAAVGEFLATHVDLTIRRSSPFPPQIAAVIDRLAAEHAALGWDPPVSGAMRP